MYEQALFPILPSLSSLIQNLQSRDFIFGQSATAWFDGCDIRVLEYPYGIITANGRPSNSDPSYYVINKSTVAAASGQSVTAESYYLGTSFFWPSLLDATFNMERD
jgi:pectin methylesterase-like acyl-CoA thioesterase